MWIPKQSARYPYPEIDKRNCQVLRISPQRISNQRVSTVRVYISEGIHWQVVTFIDTRARICDTSEWEDASSSSLTLSSSPLCSWSFFLSFVSFLFVCCPLYLHLLLSVSHLLQSADKLRGKPSSTCSHSNFVQAFSFSGVQFRVGCVCGGHGWVACAELAVDSNVGFL